MNFSSPGAASDFLLFHRYRYYALGASALSDTEYDQIEAQVRERWPWLPVLHMVGGERDSDYPDYVREKRRPCQWEREVRDKGLRKARLTYLLE